MAKRLHFVIFALALAGIVVSALVWQVHYSTATQPCDINARWDCGVVNHSRFSMMGPIPVAAIGVAGYLLLAVLSWFRRRWWTLVFAWVGLGFAAYLSYIEAYLLEVWCLYCVISQCLIALIAILAVVDVILLIIGAATRGVDQAVNSIRYG